MGRIQYFWRHPLAEQVREEGREEGRKEGREKARKEGREEGCIEVSRRMVLRLLEWRRIPVPDTARARIETCTDLDQLETWAERAVHATDAHELFTGR